MSTCDETLSWQGDFGTMFNRFRSSFASPLKGAQDVIHREGLQLVQKWKRANNY